MTELNSERDRPQCPPSADTASHDRYRLRRFVDAQQPVLAAVDAELRKGEKRTHWMWFIFPQIQGLGHSAMAKEFAIGSLDEARAYLLHPVLGPRLVEAVRHVNALEGKTAHAVFGSPDDMKFHSSVTLFALASDSEAQSHPEWKQVFLDALSKYFNGAFDPATLQRVP